MRKIDLDKHTQELFQYVDGLPKNLRSSLMKEWQATKKKLEREQMRSKLQFEDAQKRLNKVANQASAQLHEISTQLQNIHKNGHQVDLESLQNALSNCEGSLQHAFKLYQERVVTRENTIGFAYEAVGALQKRIHDYKSMIVGTREVLWEARNRHDDVANVAEALGYTIKQRELAADATQQQLESEIRELRAQCKQLTAQLKQAQDVAEKVSAQEQPAEKIKVQHHAETQTMACAQASQKANDPFNTDVHVGYCQAVSNLQVKVGVNYLVGLDKSEARLRTMANFDIGINEPIRGSGFFAGVKHSSGCMTYEYEMAQLNRKLFHRITAEGSLPSAVLRKIDHPAVGSRAGISLLTPVCRDLNVINAVRHGQIDLTSRSFGNSHPNLSVQKTLTVKHAQQATMFDQPSARVRSVHATGPQKNTKYSSAVFEPRQLVQPVKALQVSPRPDVVQTGFIILLGLALNVVLLLKKLRQLFQKNKQPRLGMPTL